jgi:hypothetical protein
MCPPQSRAAELRYLVATTVERTRSIATEWSPSELEVDSPSLVVARRKVCRQPLRTLRVQESAKAAPLSTTKTSVIRYRAVVLILIGMFHE